jgi:uroporphyrinogen-III synthase
MTARALDGRVVVITRRPEQGQELRLALEGLGAMVLELPGLEIAPPPDWEPLDAALVHLERFAWVAFTSANAVRAVGERLRALGFAVEMGRRGPRMAVVGGATAAAVGEVFRGEVAALRPEAEQSAGALAAAFSRHGVAGSSVLLPVSSRGRHDLERGLLEAGALVERVVAYETRLPEGASAALEDCLRRDPDLFVFASPSAIEGLGGPSRLRGRRVVVIGPTTEAAAREAGLEVVGVAADPSAPGLVAAALLALGRGRVPS